MSLLITAAVLATIQLADPLDEPEFYCLDISGWGENLKIDDPLQAHTCKGSTGSDQAFEFDKSQIRFTGSDRCVQVAATRTALSYSPLLLRQCSDSAMQRFELTDDNKIRLRDTRLCVTVGKDSTAAFGPSHVWRVLFVQDCEVAETRFSTWSIVRY